MPHDDDAIEITRSEEEVSHVGTRVRPVGRVRVRKRIVTEVVDVRVELRREELVIFEEPIEGAALVEGALGGSDELVLTLHAEEPVVHTRVVPRERVRVTLRVVTEHQPVTTELRAEVVEAEHGRVSPGAPLTGTG